LVHGTDNKGLFQGKWNFRNNSFKEQTRKYEALEEGFFLLKGGLKMYDWEAEEYCRYLEETGQDKQLVLFMIEYYDIPKEEALIALEEAGLPLSYYEDLEED